LPPLHWRPYALPLPGCGFTRGAHRGRVVLAPAWRVAAKPAQEPLGGVEPSGGSPPTPSSELLEPVHASEAATAVHMALPRLTLPIADGMASAAKLFRAAGAGDGGAEL
jgi:hypothetical protein